MSRFTRLAAPLAVLGLAALGALAPVGAARNDALVVPHTDALELVVAEVAGCVYCEVFRRDVMPAYSTAPETKDLPVRFIDLNAPEAARLVLSEGPLTTVPTVLLVRDGREVARAAGYMGPDGFFQAVKWMRTQDR